MGASNWSLSRLESSDSQWSSKMQPTVKVVPFDIWTACDETHEWVVGVRLHLAPDLLETLLPVVIGCSQI